LIAKYKDRWEWDRYGLSSNESLPWSEDLIAKYEDRWDWVGLSRNESLPWSEELIVKYEDRWFWHALGCINSLPWNLELIKIFTEHGDRSFDKFSSTKGHNEKIATKGNKLHQLIHTLSITQVESILNKLPEFYIPDSNISF
jgi:hypothetical protein